MAPTTAALLVLAGIIAVEALALGAWVWSLKRGIAARDQKVCELENEIALLLRAEELRAYEVRVQGMTGEERIAEYNRTDPHPDLDDGAGG